MSDTAIVAAVATFVTSIAAAIAYGQWQTAKWKLIADLYPLRHAAYLKIMEAFDFWYRQGPMTPERFDKLENAFISSRFLFGPEVRKRFDTTMAEIANLANTEMMIERHDEAVETGLDVDELSEQENELRWEEVQRITTLLYEFYTDEEIFLPYLALEHKMSSRFNLRPWRRRPKAVSEDEVE